MTDRKTANTLFSTPEPHWVGDGFPVRSVFSVHGHDASAISPFLLFDYAGPHTFEASDSGESRGVDQHPHRGFETVTIVYQGELEHRDSSGAWGHIGPGDVQWMTAASGIVHEERHSDDFTLHGGTLEMIQLWVNLPAQAKAHPPRYQDISAESIPTAVLPDDAGTLRVIAGAFGGTKGPAATVTPMNVWDVAMRPRNSAALDLPAGTNTIVVVLHGTATVAGVDLTAPGGVLLSQDGTTVEIEAGQSRSQVVILNGAPINEPVVAHGPFVMTTADEIRQAIADYQSGRMGRLESVARRD